jgi:hypothetical protein
MKSKLSSDNSATLAKYSALAGHTPARFMNVDAEGYKRFVKKILSVSVILLALFSIPSIGESATIRGSVMEIHSGAGRAAGAEQVTVTLYREVLGSSDLQKVEAFRTGIDGLYHFENVPKGEYTIHVQDPNVKEPNWGPAAYRRVSVADDKAVIELDPTVIDYK